MRKELGIESYRVTEGPLSSDKSVGNNGAFQVPIFGNRYFFIISDGGGWDHVSITMKRQRCPTWNEMCMIKNIFWEEHEAVIQIHPAKEDYINNVKYCLHLWKNQSGMDLPPSSYVGLKGIEI